MKYQYQIKLDTEFKPNQYVIMLSEELGPVQYFINSTIYNTEKGEWVLEGIDKVLQGVSKTEHRSSEGWAVEIYKNYSRAYGLFDDNRRGFPIEYSSEQEMMDDTKNGCLIETIELRELVNSFVKEIENKSKR
jgi:hypothetical protein